MEAVAPLRRASGADFAALAALERACFQNGDGAFNARQLRALLANPNAYWLMRADARAMACWLHCNNGRARWARLYSLAVHPDLRGQGIAPQLLNAGMRWMQDQGLHICRAEVKADNAAARRLYARFGFRETGALRDYYAPGIDGVRLELAVNAAHRAA